jgi:RNA polymerase sigma-70 factor (ECF subfamily)
VEPRDEDLVQRTRAGDEEAYAVLVRRRYPRCLRYALHMLGNRADAEEAVQDAFVRAYRALDRYEERQRFEAWLFRILVNQCRTLGRRRGRRERSIVSYEDPPAVAAPEDGDVHLRLELEHALQQLTPEYREALLLHHVEDQSYEDAARATGASVSALKMRVMRAREQLRHILEEDHET